MVLNHGMIFKCVEKKTADKPSGLLPSSNVFLLHPDESLYGVEMDLISLIIASFLM